MRKNYLLIVMYGIITFIILNNLVIGSTSNEYLNKSKIGIIIYSDILIEWKENYYHKVIINNETFNYWDINSEEDITSMNIPTYYGGMNEIINLNSTLKIILKDPNGTFIESPEIFIPSNVYEKNLLLIYNNGKFDWYFIDQHRFPSLSIPIEIINKLGGCNNIHDKYKRICYETAIEKGNLPDCEKETNQDLCLQSIASKTLDSDLCFKMKGKNFKNSCLIYTNFRLSFGWIKIILFNLVFYLIIFLFIMYLIIKIPIRLWIRIGIIGIFIAILISALGVLNQSYVDLPFLEKTLYELTDFSWSFLPTEILDPCEGEGCMAHLFLIYPINSIIGFFLGSIIGFVINKYTKFKK